MSSRMQTFTSAAEIVSAVAVVVTLVVLIASVRENTAAMQAAAAASSRDSMVSMNDLFLTLDDDDLNLFLAAAQSDSSLDGFSELEQFKLLVQQRSFFRRAEAQYFRYRNGLLDDDAWQTTLFRVWANIQPPAERALWEEDKHRVYTSGFVDTVEAYRPATPAPGAL